MLRFENEGTTISVKLPKTDYIVYMMANYSKETDTYHTKLYIVRKDVSDLVLIDDDYEMKSNFSSIRFEILLHKSKIVLFSFIKFPHKIRALDFSKALK